MKYIKLIKEILKGNKTYIIGVMMIVIGYLEGNTELIMEGLGVITLRAGIASSK